MDNVLEQLIKVTNHNFDFQKKVSVNMELIQSNVAQMATYSIVIGIPQLTLTLLQQDGHQIQLRPQIFLNHACHTQVVHAQPRA
jgi:hypothetical protein